MLQRKGSDCASLFYSFLRHKVNVAAKKAESFLLVTRALWCELFTIFFFFFKTQGKRCSKKRAQSFLLVTRAFNSLRCWRVCRKWQYLDMAYIHQNGEMAHVHRLAVSFIALLSALDRFAQRSPALCALKHGYKVRRRQRRTSGR